MKIKTLLAVALMTVSGLNAMAQTDLETFQFVDKNGNAIADGSTLTISETEDKGQGLQVSTGLFVKNTTNQQQATGVEFNVSNIDNGSFSCCFPMNCQSVGAVGNYENAADLFEANESRDFSSEWLPKSYGTCKVSVQLKLYNVTEKEMEINGNKFTYPVPGDFKAYGPKVTLNLVYADPAGINGVQDNAGAKVVSRYNAAGMQINSAVKGLNIEKLSNGKTIKRIVK